MCVLFSFFQIKGLEKYVMTKLFSRVFASLPDDVKQDEILSEKMALVQQFVRPENLDIKPTFQNETSWLVSGRIRVSSDFVYFQYEVNLSFCISCSFELFLLLFFFMFDIYCTETPPPPHTHTHKKTLKYALLLSSVQIVKLVSY